MDIDRLLHDADRKVGGVTMALMMGDGKNARQMTAEAVALYRQALDADPEMADPAWAEDGNRDDDWLNGHGFRNIVAVTRQRRRRG